MVISLSGGGEAWAHHLEGWIADSCDADVNVVVFVAVADRREDGQWVTVSPSPTSPGLHLVNDAPVAGRDAVKQPVAVGPFLPLVEIVAPLDVYGEHGAFARGIPTVDYQLRNEQVEHRACLVGDLGQLVSPPVVGLSVDAADDALVVAVGFYDEPEWRRVEIGGDFIAQRVELVLCPRKLPANAR